MFARLTLGASDSHEPPVRPAVLKVAPTLISAPGRQTAKRIQSVETAW